VTIAIPDAPDFAVPWDDMDRSFEWIRRMRNVQQDPIHHAEGDVWIHTRMVCEAMAGDPLWRALDAEARQVTWLSALLHDVAKPDCTRVELDGRIHARGHSQRGSIMARVLLWQMGLPFRVRERVTALVRHHQVPFFAVERQDARRVTLGMSIATRCDHLALLAAADARGRTCVDQARILDAVALFREIAKDDHCLDAPYGFPSPHSRFRYFERDGRDPDYLPHDDFRCEVIVMSGMPGAGKDAYIAKHFPGWPVVSLDALRDELDVAPEDAQGAVVQAARERAREHLRARRAFVWNATNLSREVRSKCIGLMTDYGARVRVVYVEVSPDTLRSQNRARPAARIVPEAVMTRLLARWEVPDATEAHDVTHVIAEDD
jgi:predicted kinase